ncbi:MAG TPA: hypothetical protein P5137_08535, partial [Candidatus Brocadiia bacterium]|nr:hypothetical protein [Candidatus Brocadiia bacterium]
VAAMSAPTSDGLRAMAFLDGHVQTVVESQAKVMIQQATAAIAQRMAPEKRPGFLWKQDDAFDKGVTWAAFTWGVVRVHGRDSREFRNILGEEEPAPTAVAFTDDAVWLGARRGLFRWDRKTGVWTRVAVAGRMFTPSVTKVEILDGKMSVTATEGGAPETCVFDLAAKRWLQNK